MRGRLILSGASDGQTLFWLGRSLLSAVRDLVHRHAAEIAPRGRRGRIVVKRATDRVGQAQKYDQFAAQGPKLGLIKGDEANIEQYVTHKCSARKSR
jgi:hypothetical protein